MHFSKGQVYTIKDMKCEDGKWVASSTRWENLWFPLDSTDAVLPTASKPVKDTAAHIAPPPSSKPVPVFLKELDGTQHTVNIHLSDSVAALKAEICKLKSWGADYKIRLLYEGKHLAPDSASLSSFHVQRHSVIFIIVSANITPPQEEEEEEEECCICYGATISREDAAELPTDTCKHAKRSVCDNCLARHVQAEVSEKGLANRKVCCPQEGCKAIMAHHNVQRWAIASVFETYDTLLLRAHLQSLEDFRWCAWPGCGSGQIHPAMDQNPIIKCIKCKRKTCFTHRCQWHEGRTCRQYDQDAAECEEVALLQALEGGGNLRKCPKCGQGIEKNKGCDHMTCRKPMGCGHEFCWRCLAPYDGDDGIRKVGNKAHKESCTYYM